MHLTSPLRRLSRFLGSLLHLGSARHPHREYVGGMWEEIGTLQFNFLLSRGLKPESYLLDIGCGSLRLGVKAIPYLERSHYLGIEKHARLAVTWQEKNSRRSSFRPLSPSSGSGSNSTWPSPSQYLRTSRPNRSGCA